MELSEEQLGLRYQVRIATVSSLYKLALITSFVISEFLRPSFEFRAVSRSVLVPVSSIVFAIVSSDRVAHILFITPSLDVAFLISNHFKNKRQWSRPKGPTDVLYSELGGRRMDA